MLTTEPAVSPRSGATLGRTSRAVLPSGLRDFGEVIPLTHIVIAIQDAWFGFGWATTDLSIIAAIPAIRIFRWD